MILPHKQSPRSGQILVLLLLSLLGGSGLIGVGIFATGHSIDDIEDRVDDSVGDKASRVAAEKVLDLWKADGESYLEENAERRGKLLDKLERHDTRPEQLRALFSGMQAANQKIQGRALDRRFELKALMTREEWEKVFPR